MWLSVFAAGLCSLLTSSAFRLHLPVKVLPPAGNIVDAPWLEPDYNQDTLKVSALALVWFSHEQ